MPTVDVSVVVPALNERKNLEILLPRIRKVLLSLAADSEIIVVDGGSADGTPDVARAAGARVVLQTEKGFGRALWQGILASTGRWVATMDADGSHDPDYLRLLYANRVHADVVLASRYVPAGGAECACYRDLLSRILNWFARHVCSVPLQDVSGGFRGYWRHIFDEFSLESKDFNIQIEAVIKAFAYGFRVIEAPYTYKERHQGASHARIIRYGWSFLRTILRFWRMRNTVYFADYDERAYRSKIPVQRWWQRRRYRIITSLLADARPILDAGCGSGHFILAHPEVIGLDIDRRKLRFIRCCHDRSIASSLSSLPFLDGVFGQVICSEAIEHVPQKRQPLVELWRVLRPGGILILSTPDYGVGLWRAIERIYKAVLPGAYADLHVSKYDGSELIRALQKLGFRIEHFQRMFGCILFVKARKPK